MPISDSTFLHMAEEILSSIKRWDPKFVEFHTGAIEYKIFHYLRTRDSSEQRRIAYEANFNSFEEDFHKRVYSLNFGPHAKRVISDSGSWFHVSPDIPDRQQVELGPFRVLYKSYFTFGSKHKFGKEIYLDILTFLGMLPRLFNALYTLSVQKQDYIQFKFQARLKGMIDDTDTLVVHYTKKGLAPEIEREMHRLFTVHGLVVRERHIKANRGFDFTNVVSKEGHSHSQLIAKVLAKEVVKHKDYLLRMEPKNIANWLKKDVMTIGMWNDHEMLSAL